MRMGTRLNTPPSSAPKHNPLNRGYTILDDLHNPVWNWAVDRLPMWLAPNLITLVASACIFAAYALNVAYLPDFTGECHCPTTERDRERERERERKERERQRETERQRWRAPQHACTHTRGVPGGMSLIGFPDKGPRDSSAFPIRALGTHRLVANFFWGLRPRTPAVRSGFCCVMGSHNTQAERQDT
jgi:hypothetical protein